MDGFLHRLKHEVELMNRMVMCMDAFTGDQTRLVVIVDGLDSCEQDKVRSYQPYKQQQRIVFNTFFLVYVVVVI